MENLERMAREYREILENSSTDSTLVLEQIIIIEENQLELLTCIQKASTPALKTVNYIKNLIFRSLNKLNVLLGRTSYVPRFRSGTITCESIPISLLGAQIDIFVLLDELNLAFIDIAEILSLENRKLGFISSL